jgi:hypothetical protein
VAILPARSARQCYYCIRHIDLEFFEYNHSVTITYDPPLNHHATTPQCVHTASHELYHLALILTLVFDGCTTLLVDRNELFLHEPACDAPALFGLLVCTMMG